MVHHEKIRSKLAEKAPHLSRVRASGLHDIIRLWRTYAFDTTCGPSLASYTRAPCAQWTGALGHLIHVPPLTTADYHVQAIDGSQIYPDMHELPAYLINIGHLDIQYGSDAYAYINADPYLHFPQHVPEPAAIDRIRLSYEIMYLTYSTNGSYVLFDGPLTWWQCAKYGSLKDCVQYLARALAHGACVMGYTSHPRFMDVTRALLSAPFLYHTDEVISEQARGITDAQLMSHVLSPWQRTPLCTTTDPVHEAYPAWLRPYFCYLHTGKEVARIEIPTCVAQSKKRVTDALSVIRDQIEKGHGYPIALSEAHEAAVVREADRRTFIDMLAWYLDEPALSQKQYLKRRPII